MKPNNLKLFTALRTSLRRERAALLERVQAIETALGATSAGPAIAPKVKAAAGPRMRRRKMSAAGRAAIAAAAKARWARFRAAKAKGKGGK